MKASFRKEPQPKEPQPLCFSGRTIFEKTATKDNLVTARNTLYSRNISKKQSKMVSRARCARLIYSG